MTFNLSGYQAEEPKEGTDFEAFKYNGIASVESSIISQNTERDTEFYPMGCNMIEIAVICMEEKPFKGEQTLGRKLWKRFNLDAVEEDKRGKTSVMKLADQLFPLGLEFNNIEELRAVNEKLIGMDIIVKAWPVDFKDGRGAQQMWNIKGKAGSQVPSGTTPSTSGAQQVAF